MDPQKTWRELSKAVEQEDWHQAGIHADDLIGWLAKGGFPPKITGIEAFDRVVAKATCKAIACWDVA